MTTPPTPAARVVLRVPEKADGEIARLDRAVIGAVYQFQREFRRDPWGNGLRLKPLKGDSRLWSARVNRDYRALLLKLGEADWMLVAVKPRSGGYENLDRYAYGINQVTGDIEYVDLDVVTDSVFRRAAASGVPIASGTTPQQPEDALFAAYSSAQLAELGVAEPLIPIILKLTTDDELLGLVEYAPSHTAEVLLRLRDGVPFDDVMEQVTAPVVPEEAVDTDDWHAAADRSRAIVITDDEALQQILEEGDFGHWKRFLHPTQRKLVTRAYSGPARVSGGPGTGKTIVALHRVKHLVDNLPPGRNRPILLTTFNRNLAADLRTRLVALGGPETSARVDIVNIDQLATKVVREADTGTVKRRINDKSALGEWRTFLVEADEDRWEAEFLHDEWNQVILGQAVHTRSEYFRARRAGRGRSLARADRAEIWALVERFTQRLDRLGVETHAQIAERAAMLETERKAKIDRRQQQLEAPGPANIHTESGSGAWLRYRYRHIVVDEAQDMSAAHWKLMRAMVPAAPNDLFLVGDTHQRIYDHQVTLGSLGVNIRGRSSRLTLSYRTTREILQWAQGVVDGVRYDDLDGGVDDIKGYRSVLHGELPIRRGLATQAQERDAVADQIEAWSDVRRADIAVCVPTNEMAAAVAQRLMERGIPATEITRDGPTGDEGVHIGTMYRFKGLEYRRMIVAGVSEGLVPRAAVDVWAGRDAARHARELLRARSLLFVAATRARDALAVFWHGEPSRFLRHDPACAP
ncbi:ATP-dependent helicase [Yinghuangia aomiensis]|uniref:DNA 3'-5' helicase n=1 Tax=Yinghuangia aomiensis TaxID=676205 RepID=A0ABP9GYR2_9ACTN